MPLTEDLPKALLAVMDDRSILELALDNLSRIGMTDVLIVTGHAADRIEVLLPSFESRYGISLHTVRTEHAALRNNAYSLWLARGRFDGGVLVVNGDTVHPAGFLDQLLEAAVSAPEADLLLAVDFDKSLGEEEMKVDLSDTGQLRTISKLLAPGSAAGEFIGISLITPAGAAVTAEALERSWSRDPGHYYEDAYQLLADAGRNIKIVPVSGGPWIEVDTHDDLARARALR